METQQVIYLDNNATTPIDKRVLEVMMPFLTNQFANAHSNHQFGAIANEAVELARKKVAELIGAELNEIVFTSGATEAINMALKGVAETYATKGNHIITITTEHSAVLDTCAYLEEKGYQITYLPVQPDGLIDLNDLKVALRPDTILVSAMYVNNETGVVQPIKEIANMAHAAGALFMSDCTQAVGKIGIDVDDLGIDLLCLSGHKMYAPKGIGALFVRQRDNRVKLSTLLHGGGHERGLRSGTLNVPGIVALGTACDIAQNEMAKDIKSISFLRNVLERELVKLPGTFVNGTTAHRVCGVSNICFSGLDANILIGQMKNVAVSNGSACSAAVIEPSHVLSAMGLSDDDAFASIRFSIGRFNTENDIQAAIRIISALIQSHLNHA